MCLGLDRVIGSMHQELTDFMYTSPVQGSLKQSFDSLEARAAFERIEDDFQRILEARSP